MNEAVHSTQDVVRLHEKWMDFTETRLDYLEKRLNQIPWILFGVAVNCLISILAVVLSVVLRRGTA